MTPGGLPHSGIDGSPPADNSPSLIAAIHALLRLVAPRHPPCALLRSAPRVAPCQANRIDLYQLLPHRSTQSARRQAPRIPVDRRGSHTLHLSRSTSPPNSSLGAHPTRLAHLRWSISRPETLRLSRDSSPRTIRAPPAQQVTSGSSESTNPQAVLLCD